MKQGYKEAADADMAKAVLQEAFRYDRETGAFYWRRDQSKRKKAGNLATTRSSKGLRLELNGVVYAAHRVAFLFIFGRWPTVVFHANGDKLDNRESNIA